MLAPPRADQQLTKQCEAYEKNVWTVKFNLEYGGKRSYCGFLNFACLMDPMAQDCRRQRQRRMSPPICPNGKPPTQNIRGGEPKPKYCSCMFCPESDATMKPTKDVRTTVAMDTTTEAMETTTTKVPFDPVCGGALGDMCRPQGKVCVDGGTVNARCVDKDTTTGRRVTTVAMETTTKGARTTPASGTNARTADPVAADTTTEAAGTADPVATDTTTEAAGTADTVAADTTTPTTAATTSSAAGDKTAVFTFKDLDYDTTSLDLLEFDLRIAIVDLALIAEDTMEKTTFAFEAKSSRQTGIRQVWVVATAVFPDAASAEQAQAKASCVYCSYRWHPYPPLVSTIGDTQRHARCK